jgi:large subunit ribosomal protein L21
MYAIVEIAGQQFKVEKDSKIFVHRLAGEVGTQIEFGDVLLIDNEGAVKVGAPKVDGAKISAKILAHVRGEKVLIFKKKRRKSYQKLNGHRQDFSQILVESIVA